ncbi:hypothetical protein ATE48_07665 [Candidatus Viadribacter manganicus]|uniref:Uncharacterized protein n=1 Tax=Candidatus Viadribacter manganicus TaxID=1759059 RepID=A0A1B1AGX2_9PROT|nr:hypothetical protein ATE48_07665 [Candidatus Viadribacter manganicus]
MKIAPTHLAQTRAHQDLASWENEGGSTRSVAKTTQARVVTIGWPPASVINPIPATLSGADKGMADTNSLTMMRVSLLLLVPALGSLAIFWGAVAANGPR